MRKLCALRLILVVLLSAFAVSTIAASTFNTSIHERVIIIEAIPPTDDSMTNPDCARLNYHWYTTINYYVNPTNSYDFSTSTVINTITTSVNAWDVETSYQVFSYKGTTTRLAGTRPLRQPGAASVVEPTKAQPQDLQELATAATLFHGAPTKQAS